MYFGVSYPLSPQLLDGETLRCEKGSLKNKCPGRGATTAGSWQQGSFKKAGNQRRDEIPTAKKLSSLPKFTLYQKTEVHGIRQTCTTIAHCLRDVGNMEKVMGTWDRGPPTTPAFLRKVCNWYQAT